MIITNRQRAYGQGKTYVKNKRKIPLNFDLSSLDLLCNFVISENRNVRRLQYINLRNLIEMLDMENIFLIKRDIKEFFLLRKD